MNRLANTTQTDIERREAMLDRIERMTELPMMVLAFLMVPLLAAPWNCSAMLKTTRSIQPSSYPGTAIWPVRCGPSGIDIPKSGPLSHSRQGGTQPVFAALRRGTSP